MTNPNQQPGTARQFGGDPSAPMPGAAGMGSIQSFPFVLPPPLWNGRVPGLGADPLTQPSLPKVVQALLERPVSFYQERPANDALDAPALTNVAFVLDSSTSMLSGLEATIEGFNTQVAVVKEGVKDAGRTTFTDVRFGTGVELRVVAGELSAMAPLSRQTYCPSGMTALYDALGATIAALLETNGIDNPKTATLLTLFTDGDENMSRTYTAVMLRAMIERLEATGRWTFALVGPSHTVTGLASLLSVKQANTAGYDVHSVSDKRKAFDKVAGASATFMSMRSVGSTQAVSLYADQELKG